jgi:FdhD protein
MTKIGQARLKPPATKLGSQRRSVALWADGEASHNHSDTIAEERAVALVYNGISHAVMMASPQDLIDFATGFSFTEGIIDSPRDIYAIEQIDSELGTELAISLSAAKFNRLKQRRRTLAGSTGCGLCGTESLQQLPARSRPVSDHHPISHQAIQQALASLVQLQPLQAITGSVHGAAWCNEQGTIELLREDVGRHNALDKLIGARLAQATTAAPGFALISSRASYEMVQKAAQAGIAVLVAVSAATSLAVDTAEQAGVTLVGFGRSGRHVIYSCPERLCN